MLCNFYASINSNLLSTCSVVCGLDWLIDWWDLLKFSFFLLLGLLPKKMLNDEKGLKYCSIQLNHFIVVLRLFVCFFLWKKNRLFHSSSEMKVMCFFFQLTCVTKCVQHFCCWFLQSSWLVVSQTSIFCCSNLWHTMK